MIDWTGIEPFKQKTMSTPTVEEKCRDVRAQEELMKARRREICGKLLKGGCCVLAIVLADNYTPIISWGMNGFK